MPPSVVQTGAAVLAGARLDSHVLVGSGALLEEDVLVGCGTMLGGVLQPPEALPVILERGAAVGGNCGLYGSIVVGQQTQIIAGTVIRALAGAFDARSGQWLRPGSDGALRLPPGVIVEMGLPPADLFPDGIPRLTPVLS
jgi:2,3,4,5-tetrahydropyridine-2-carboxylate N-succinyltransferase